MTDWYICNRRDECGDAECEHAAPHERMDTCDDDTCPAVEGVTWCDEMGPTRAKALLHITNEACRLGAEGDYARAVATELASELAECYASRIGDEWADVEAELESQVEKWGVQHHPDGLWHLILAEEVGEVARAILQHKRGDIENEIVQCAAVCLAWLKDRARYTPSKEERCTSAQTHRIYPRL